MLALRSPINNLHSTYSSGLAPGVQFALDLTDSNAGMSEQENYLLSRPQDTATLTPLAGNTSPFALPRHVALVARLLKSMIADMLAVVDIRPGRRRLRMILSLAKQEGECLPRDRKECDKDPLQRYIAAQIVLPHQR